MGSGESSEPILLSKYIFYEITKGYFGYVTVFMLFFVIFSGNDLLPNCDRKISHSSIARLFGMHKPG